MRHRGNNHWINVLNNVRIGEVTDTDLKYLNDQCYVSKEDEQNKHMYCPFITSSNKTRDGVNRTCVYSYAQQHNQPVYQIIAEERGKPVDTCFHSLRDDLTSRIPILLSLTIGMPVSSTYRNDSIAVLNGTKGFICGFEWHTDTQFQQFTTSNNVSVLRPSRQPKYVFIQQMNHKVRQHGNLPPGVIPVQPTKKKCILKLSHRKLSKTLTQIMVVPAFAITTDKSQGMTVSACIIDPQIDPSRKNPPPQILYVALSRVTTPLTMSFTEELRREILNKFKPNRELLKIDRNLISRYTREFY
jgi:hypothetical protein